MTYTKEEILSGNYDINLFHDVPCEVGEIYADWDGFWEILDIAGDEVKIQNIETGWTCEGVRLIEVKFYCKFGIAVRPMREEDEEEEE